MGAHEIAFMPLQEQLECDLVRFRSLWRFLASRHASCLPNLIFHSSRLAEMDKNSCPPLPTVMDLLLDAICVVDVDGRYVLRECRV